MCPTSREFGIGIQYDAGRRKFVVRWREDGRQRTRRFATEDEAAAFDASIQRNGRGRPPELDQLPEPTRSDARLRGDGIYAYKTREGIRWRFNFRQSDGTPSTRRGFASRSAAATARRGLLEEIRRGDAVVSRESFETFWPRVLRDKKPFMTAGSHEDFATHGRKRLLPYFGDDKLSAIDEDRVRDWLETMVDRVDAGELAPKSVNNARTYLSVVLEPRAAQADTEAEPAAAEPVDRGGRTSESHGFMPRQDDHADPQAEGPGVRGREGEQGSGSSSSASSSRSISIHHPHALEAGRFGARQPGGESGRSAASCGTSSAIIVLGPG